MVFGGTVAPHGQQPDRVTVDMQMSGEMVRSRASQLSGLFLHSDEAHHLVSVGGEKAFLYSVSVTT